ncbi:Root cap/late embryogenesis-like protein [Quillaja saponaria]|uniref:Root cap/late embryogenesis-like protein n=1 Tax=Quillaja saponaria TaxID=32244 RepID=A0AAD7M0N3_QUISA|nr:Root cap/late embryogenesis-like protein [Quillaja saponaria]
MAQSLVHFVVLVLLVLVATTGATPPGIAKNPSHATCKIKKYKHCYNLEHVCPKFCPDQCTVECASCKPICSGSTSPPITPEIPPTPTHSPPPSHTNPPPIVTPPSPPTPTPAPPTPTFSPPPSQTNPPPTVTPPPSPPTSTPAPPTPPTTTPSSPPPPSTSTPPTPPITTPSSPSTPTPPSSTPSSPPSTSASPKTAICKNRNFPECYNMKHVCPSACADGCEVDCVTCKPVCKCDRPGAVCQDPRFIGGNGLTFYFHGKKDRDFCIVSDSNLHINAHFIGRRNQNMKRDFTWVQSIGILFNKHQLSIGAQKTATWDDSIDRLAITFDGKPITLPESDDARWQSTSVPSVFLTRTADANNVIVEIEGSLRITAKVVHITEQDSRIHNYGITKENSFAHLDLSFKFFSLSNQVSGVLGQTYRPDYVSRVNIGANMPVMGGHKEFESSSLFATDCAVARFVSNNNMVSNTETALEGLELPSLSCASGMDGQGVVCKR